MRCTNLNPKLKPFGPGLKRSDFLFATGTDRLYQPLHLTSNSQQPGGLCTQFTYPSRPSHGRWDVLQRLHRGHRVSPHDNHPQRLFVAAVVDALVQNEVQELIEPAKHAHHTAVAVEFQAELLVHVPDEVGVGVFWGQRGREGGKPAGKRARRKRPRATEPDETRGTLARKPRNARDAAKKTIPGDHSRGTRKTPRLDSSESNPFTGRTV